MNVKVKKVSFVRLNTRVPIEQKAYIRNEAKKSKGVLTEGDVHRELLDEAINNRNAQAKVNV